jgi:hypothetical protein
VCRPVAPARSSRWRRYMFAAAVPSQRGNNQEAEDPRYSLLASPPTAPRFQLPSLNRRPPPSSAGEEGEAVASAAVAAGTARGRRVAP